MIPLLFIFFSQESSCLPRGDNFYCLLNEIVPCLIFTLGTTFALPHCLHLSILNSSSSFSAFSPIFFLKHQLSAPIFSYGTIFYLLHLQNGYPVCLNSLLLLYSHGQPIIVSVNFNFMVLPISFSPLFSSLSMLLPYF